MTCWTYAKPLFASFGMDEGNGRVRKARPHLHGQLNCYWNRDERYYKPNGWHGDALLDGGTLFTQFSHFIDIMYWLFGDICNIQAKFADFNHKSLTAFEDSGIVHFNFVNGGMGCLNYSTSVWDKNMESSLTVMRRTAR